MKKLLDAFLSLPTWQGILLIGCAVGFTAVVSIIVAEIAYRTGWKCCERKREMDARAHSVSQVSERI